LRGINLPIFGKVKCFICQKKGKKDEFIYDPGLGQYFCCEEHRRQALQFKALLEKARQKGLTICPKCLKEIRPDAYVCKYCGTKFVVFKGYEIGKMCPFAIISVGKTEYGVGEYVWQHQRCIQEYCALWDFESDKCSLATKKTLT